jgi:hypothetical protein
MNVKVGGTYSYQWRMCGSGEWWATRPLKLEECKRNSLLYYMTEPHFIVIVIIIITGIP